MIIKNKLIKLHWFFASQLGFDPRTLFRSFKGLPLYLHDLLKFRKGYTGKMEMMPCLHDRYEEGGATKSEYFWQDLLVARLIHQANPTKHVDIGSRVDGFVAHIASFRECEVFDVRPISTLVPGVVFRQADLMNAKSLPTSSEDTGYCDSLSCLHAIEHFGLGRYGDPINPLGYELGIANMAKLIRPGGYFYLSTPIGRERVEFNANRVFDPRTIVQCASSMGLSLCELTTITSSDGPNKSPVDMDTLAKLALHDYQLGLFVFKKSLK